MRDRFVGNLWRFQYKIIFNSACCVLSCLVIWWRRKPSRPYLMYSMCCQCFLYLKTVQSSYGSAIVFSISTPLRGPSMEPSHNNAVIRETQRLWIPVRRVTVTEYLRLITIKFLAADLVLNDLLSGETQQSFVLAARITEAYLDRTGKISDLFSYHCNAINQRYKFNGSIVGNIKLFPMDDYIYLYSYIYIYIIV